MWTRADNGVYSKLVSVMRDTNPDDDVAFFRDAYAIVGADLTLLFIMLLSLPTSTPVINPRLWKRLWDTLTR